MLPLRNIKKEDVKIIIYDFDKLNLKDIFDIAKDMDYVFDASGRPSYISQRIGKSNKLELGQYALYIYWRI
jgi:hypothetical protein